MNHSQRSPGQSFERADSASEFARRLAAVHQGRYEMQNILFKSIPELRAYEAERKLRAFNVVSQATQPQPELTAVPMQRPMLSLSESPTTSPVVPEPVAHQQAPQDPIELGRQEVARAFKNEEAA